jgi:hypothetical protein
MRSSSTRSQLFAEPRKTYWVNPGFSLNLQDGDTVFAEPGSTVTGNGGGAVIYLKTGSVLTSANASSNSVIYGDGASTNILLTHNFTLNCPTLNFDYSDAPPNDGVQTSRVERADVASRISIMPNPTTGQISIAGLPENVIDVSVLDILGTIELAFTEPRDPTKIDLSTLPPGVHYLRIAWQGSVVTKKIVKE